MALADRETIMEYIAQDNPAAATALDDEFEAKAEQARLRPTLYKLGRAPDTREIVVKPNYILVYQVDQTHEIVTVVRVLHAAQRWPAIKEP